MSERLYDCDHAMSEETPGPCSWCWNNFKLSAQEQVKTLESRLAAQAKVVEAARKALASLENPHDHNVIAERFLREALSSLETKGVV